MTANEKKYTKLALVIAGIILLLWWLQRRSLAASATDNGAAASSPALYLSNDPITMTFAANPGAFGPLTVNGSINVNVNGYNGINQNYMPLFGFVGMAQGELWGQSGAVTQQNGALVV